MNGNFFAGKFGTKRASAFQSPRIRSAADSDIAVAVDAAACHDDDIRTLTDVEIVIYKVVYSQGDDICLAGKLLFPKAPFWPPAA
mgnify:CR=1 FL=1